MVGCGLSLGEVISVVGTVRYNGGHAKIVMLKVVSHHERYDQVIHLRISTTNERKLPVIALKNYSTGASFQINLCYLR